MAVTRTVANPISAQAGIGLRFPHHDWVLSQRPSVPWFEIHAENFFGGGSLARTLAQVRAQYPLSVHGVGLSLGSAEGLDPNHLASLVELVRRSEPLLVSEHLSWSVIGGHYLGDLLPLPMTQEALQVVCRHVEQTQDALARQLLVENPSTYIQFAHSTLTEWEFLSELVARTGCGVLCDVNNIFVSCSNHGWDPQQYLRGLPAAAIGEIHLAGHAQCTLEDGTQVRIDHHGAPVSDEVWALYRSALERWGPRPTLIEWDTDIPAFAALQQQAAQAQQCLQVCHELAA